MAETIPISHRISRVQIPTRSITDSGNPLTDQAQFHGWLLRGLAGLPIKIPERGPPPHALGKPMSEAARAALMELLLQMIAIKAPIALHWCEADGNGPLQPAQTKTAMDLLLSHGNWYDHQQDLYELIMIYGGAGYISPKQATNGMTALEDALRARNCTTIRALVELGAPSENIPHKDLAANGFKFPAGDFEFFMKHWVRHDTKAGQTYAAACMSREIQAKTSVVPNTAAGGSSEASAPGRRRRGI